MVSGPSSRSNGGGMDPETRIESKSESKSRILGCSLIAFRDVDDIDTRLWRLQTKYRGLSS